VAVKLDLQRRLVGTQHADLDRSVALAFDVADVAATGRSKRRGDGLCALRAHEIVGCRGVRGAAFLVELAKSQIRRVTSTNEPSARRTSTSHSSPSRRGGCVSPGADPHQRGSRRVCCARRRLGGS
jgi:hypothetical protein